jgi:hypothetical protein
VKAINNFSIKSHLSKSSIGCIIVPVREPFPNPIFSRGEENEEVTTHAFRCDGDRCAGSLCLRACHSGTH